MAEEKHLGFYIGEIMIKGKTYSEYKVGVICVVACQVIWGILPIYWQALMPINSWIIILYRIFTMAIYSLLAARTQYTFKEIFSPLKERKVRTKYFTAGLVLTANWSIYIWAINSGRVIQTSIGYYIEPLVICLFGIVIFKEKMTKYNLTAMLLALAAVVMILIHYGQIPAVALGLALTWATYSAVKKTANQPPLLSLVYETILYGVLAGIAIIYLETKGIGGLSYNLTGKYLFMLLAGFLSLIPIVLFAVSAKKVTLLVIGLAQYISPTITLLCGIFLFGESIDRFQLIAFGIIWLGLVFFTIGEFKNNRKGQK